MASSVKFSNSVQTKPVTDGADASLYICLAFVYQTYYVPSAPIVTGSVFMRIFRMFSDSVVCGPIAKSLTVHALQGDPGSVSFSTETDPALNIFLGIRFQLTSYIRIWI